MKLIKWILTGSLAGMFLFWGCQDSLLDTKANSNLLNSVQLLDNQTWPCERDLYAGQNILVGKVIIDLQGDNLIITYNTDMDWFITETHLYIGSGPPEKSSPGQFPYKHEDINTQQDTYEFPLTDLGLVRGDCFYVAAHAVVSKENIECIGFESFDEKAQVESVSTSAGDVTFYMIKKLDDLVVGDIAEFELPDSETDYYPIVAKPQTTGGNPDNYDNIVAFTVKGQYANDDLVYIENGTGASGNTLTDPQDLSQTKLLQHAYHKGLAIVVDVSEIEDYESINFAAVDLDHGELWRFQYFNSANELIEVQTLNGLDQSGDGKAFAISNLDPDVAKIVIWGGMNNGDSEVVGYAFDNFCITTLKEETAWGSGDEDFEKGWGSYYQCCLPSCQEWIVYGNNLGTTNDPYGVGGDQDDIFAVDLNNKTISLLYNSNVVRSNENYPNGNAYDPAKEWVYYATNDGYIIVYDKVANDRSNGLKDELNPETRSIACGAYYNGSYYYIPQGTDDLIKATVSFDGTWSLTSQEIGSISGNTRTFSFGDIVFDINNLGLLLGSASSNGQAYYFKYDLDSNTYTEVTKDTHLQLAFASNGVLYGLSAKTGDWYEIDPATGNETLFWENSGIHLTDLADGPQCGF